MQALVGVQDGLDHALAKLLALLSRHLGQEIAVLLPHQLANRCRMMILQDGRVVITHGKLVLPVHIP